MQTETSNTEVRAQTIALWDPISNTFRRSLTFTNCRDELIKCLAFVPSSHYLVSATANQVKIA